MLIPSLCFAQSNSENTIGGYTAQAHLISASGDTLAPTPYLDFEGCSGADVNGKTVITCSGSGGGGGAPGQRVPPAPRTPPGSPGTGGGGVGGVGTRGSGVASGRSGPAPRSGSLGR